MITKSGGVSCLGLRLTRLIAALRCHLNLMKINSLLAMNWTAMAFALSGRCDFFLHLLFGR